MSRQLKEAAKLAKKARTAAIYNKAKSPLRGFEFVENLPNAPTSNLGQRPLANKLKGKLPNANFQYKAAATGGKEEDVNFSGDSTSSPVLYKSYQSYVNEATKARWRINSDPKEGWWLKISDLNEKFYLPEGINKNFGSNALKHEPTIGQKYRSTKKTRLEILKNNKKEKPLTTSPINCIIDLDELSAVDFKIQDWSDKNESGKASSLVGRKNADPDQLLSGEFYNEQIVKVLSMYGVFKDLSIERFSPREDCLIEFSGNFVMNFGNELAPREMASAPKIDYIDDPNHYTTALISLDSGVDGPASYIHYLNHKTKVNANFLKFFPFRGTGYHRVVALTWKNLPENVFEKVFYKFFTENETGNSNNLKSREISENDLFNFKSKNQTQNHEKDQNYDDTIIELLENHLISIKLSVTRWDRSVTATCHQDLQIKEPTFEYNYHDISTARKAPMTKYTEENRSSGSIEKSMAEETIYPGLGQPEEYQTSSGMNEFNGVPSFRRRKGGR